MFKKDVKQNNNIQILINNTFEGFLNYLTSSNIRQKIKHPLFLAIYFSNVVTLQIKNDIYSDNTV